MKRGERLLIAGCCVLLLIVSWIVAVSGESDEEKQAKLVSQAQAYLEDKIYIRAIPLLEEAAQYGTDNTYAVEETLKGAYLALDGEYDSEYEDLLDAQMSREDARAETFLEAAEYRFAEGDISEGIAALRNGAEKTGSEELRERYERERYAYETGRSSYTDVTTALNGAIQVKKGELWGLASASGSGVIPCLYEKVSTYYNGEVVVKSGGEIYAVDTENHRIALLHAEADDFTNLNGNRMAVRMSDGWHLADGSLNVGSAAFEEIGLFSEGYAAAKQGGKWGVIDSGGSWFIEPEYDGIVTDELGRCCGSGAIFARSGNSVVLIVGGERTEYSFEDARPFDGGYAAVKSGGKWGFISPDGELKIQYGFDDALSFGQHLAAVEIDGLWGYISLRGKVVIEPVFKAAKSFCQGSAPVLTENGWQFIKLCEYEGG